MRQSWDMSQSSASVYVKSHINHVTDYATIVKFVRPLSKTIKRDLDQTVSLARQVQVRY